MFHISRKLIYSLTFLILIATASAQSELQTRTLVINGHTGEVIIYRIDGKTFISLEALAQIGTGSLSFRGNQVIVTLPASRDVVASSSDPVTGTGMSNEFMKAGIQDLAIIRDWHTTLAHAIQRGVPGDGSRLAVFHDKAAEGLRLAAVATTNSSDHNALQLLTNHFNQVDNWTRKLVQERKSMSTAQYSVTPNALENDSQYQQITTCSQFLGQMLAAGQYEDGASCH
jgi:hypothetical protein